MHPKNTTNVVCDRCKTHFYKPPSRICSRNYCSRDCYHSRAIRPVIDNGDGTATVPIAGGHSAVIDSIDSPLVSQQSWSLAGSSKYARTLRGGVFIQMHRLILGAENGEIVDHANGDTLDNRRCNLRLATASQSSANTRVKASSESGYKGVRKSRSTGRWVAYIGYGKYTHIGNFGSPEEAARAYDAAATETFGDFAHLNFPPDKEIA